MNAKYRSYLIAAGAVWSVIACAQVPPSEPERR